jgi:hypothetical protein
LLAIGALANHLCRLLDADWCLLVDHYPPLVPPEGHLIPRGEVRICVLGPAARTTAAVELTAAPRHGRGERGELITSVPTSAGPLRISTQLLGGHPEILQDRIAKAALFELFGALRGAPGDGDRGGLTGQRHFGSAERR